MASTKHLYRITFTNQGSVYEIYARHVSQSAILGFVEVGPIVFGQGSQVVIDPSEDRLRTEFSGVKRFYVPIHSVVRIDEVERQGPARITAVDKRDARDGHKVSPFPLLTPPAGKPRRG
jgi:hypothetical protein